MMANSSKASSNSSAASKALGLTAGRDSPSTILDDDSIDGEEGSFSAGRRSSKKLPPKSVMEVLNDKIISLLDDDENDKTSTIELESEKLNTIYKFWYRYCIQV